MKTLDRTRPFGTIFGVHRARYTQDGAEFDIKGRMLGGKPEPAIVVQEEVSLDNLSVKEIKGLVAAAGGEYKNRLEAIEFLKETESNDVS